MLNGVHAMNKLALMLIALLSAGCETYWVVPPANGRVVDARSRQPIAQAEVTRVCEDAPAQTTTDSNGRFKFRGKRTIQLALGDPVCTPASYRIEAKGYETVETNGVGFGTAQQNGLRHDIGEIQLTPR